ncbi:Outer membrane usher protein HtrE precursor [compost metagenome]
MPQALRAGSSRFSATAGALRDASGHLQALRFAEGTYARGINNRLTALGGAQLGEDYQALLAGAAINTAIGAFGADVTHSRARLRGCAATRGSVATVTGSTTSATLPAPAPTWVWPPIATAPAAT